MGVVQQVKRETDPVEAVRLIENHSFDVNIMPSHLLSHASVWEAALARLPLRRVLDHMKAMARKNLLSGPESPVLVRLLKCLVSPLALTASKLQPGEIMDMVTLTQVGRRWALLPRIRCVCTCCKLLTMEVLPQSVHSPGTHHPVPPHPPPRPDPGHGDDAPLLPD